jgi:protease-4
MGDIAASGGVWVTTSSDHIFAEEDTLTGSIGVYGIIPTLDGIYDWAGIKVDGTTSTKASEWDERQSMPEYVKDSIQAGIDNVYFKFVSKVSDNRLMEYEDLLPFAGGRIWSGSKALEIGLVDTIGDLKDALNYAAKLADIDEYSVKTYTKEIDPFDAFLLELFENIDIKSSIDPRIEMLIGEYPKHMMLIKPDTQNVMAYCFECEALMNYK